MSTDPSFLQSHLHLSHKLWEQHLSPTDTVIDATCGNGYDTLALLKMIPNGHLIAIDRQPLAIQSTLCKLTREQKGRTTLYTQCHSQFPKEIAPRSVALVVYNLGYLPGGDKRLTTLCDTTLQSVHSAQFLLKQGGLISIVCYPGHSEGAIEERALSKFATSLDKKMWNCSAHAWVNRWKHPSVLLIQRVGPIEH